MQIMFKRSETSLALISSDRKFYRTLCDTRMVLDGIVFHQITQRTLKGTRYIFITRSEINGIILWKNARSATKQLCGARKFRTRSAGETNRSKNINRAPSRECWKPPWEYFDLGLENETII